MLFLTTLLLFVLTVGKKHKPQIQLQADSFSISLKGKLYSLP